MVSEVESIDTNFYDPPQIMLAVKYTVLNF